MSDFTHVKRTISEQIGTTFLAHLHPTTEHQIGDYNALVVHGILEKVKNLNVQSTSGGDTFFRRIVYDRVYWGCSKLNEDFVLPTDCMEVNISYLAELLVDVRYQVYEVDFETGELALSEEETLLRKEITRVPIMIGSDICFTKLFFDKDFIDYLTDESAPSETFAIFEPLTLLEKNKLLRLRDNVVKALTCPGTYIINGSAKVACDSFQVYYNHPLVLPVKNGGKYDFRVTSRYQNYSGNASHVFDVLYTEPRGKSKGGLVYHAFFRACKTRKKNIFHLFCMLGYTPLEGVRLMKLDFIPEFEHDSIALLASTYESYKLLPAEKKDRDVLLRQLGKTCYRTLKGYEYSPETNIFAKETDDDAIGVDELVDGSEIDEDDDSDEDLESDDGDIIADDADVVVGESQPFTPLHAGEKVLRETLFSCTGIDTLLSDGYPQQVLSDTLENEEAADSLRQRKAHFLAMLCRRVLYCSVRQRQIDEGKISPDEYRDFESMDRDEHTSRRVTSASSRVERVLAKNIFPSAIKISKLLDDPEVTAVKALELNIPRITRDISNGLSINRWSAKQNSKGGDDVCSSSLPVNEIDNLADIDKVITLIGGDQKPPGLRKLKPSAVGRWCPWYSPEGKKMGYVTYCSVGMYLSRGYFSADEIQYFLMNYLPLTKFILTTPLDNGPLSSSSSDKRVLFVNGRLVGYISVDNIDEFVQTFKFSRRGHEIDRTLFYTRSLDDSSSKSPSYFVDGMKVSKPDHIFPVEKFLEKVEKYLFEVSISEIRDEIHIYSDAGRACRYMFTRKVMSDISLESESTESNSESDESVSDVSSESVVSEFCERWGERNMMRQEKKYLRQNRRIMKNHGELTVSSGDKSVSVATQLTQLQEDFFHSLREVAEQDFETFRQQGLIEVVDVYEEMHIYEYEKEAYEYLSEFTERLINDEILTFDEIREKYDELYELLEGDENEEFVCRRETCGSSNVKHFAVQDRSGDEGASTYVECKDCGYRYRVGN